MINLNMNDTIIYANVILKLSKCGKDLKSLLNNKIY